MKHTLALACALALAACGGKSSSSTAPKTAEPTPLAPGAWEGMNDEARTDLLELEVLQVEPEEAAVLEGVLERAEAMCTSLAQTLGKRCESARAAAN